MAHKMHPNSLKNLKPSWTSETAREAGAKGHATMRANAAARETLKLSTKEWEKYKSHILSDTSLNAVDVLKILMLKALEEGDNDTAADLAKSLAEFESPKLARVDKTSVEMTAEELSDEEIEEKLRELGLKS